MISVAPLAGDSPRLLAAESVESHARRHAKRLLLTWLRETAAKVGYDEYANFAGLSWRVNRPAPHWGIWCEYPVLAEGHGIDTVWDEVLRRWRKRSPTYDELIAAGLRPTAVLDIAIQHKGTIAFAIEVVHKHHCEPQKIAFLSDQLTLLEIPAYWVLGQVDRPTEIPCEFYL